MGVVYQPPQLSLEFLHHYDLQYIDLNHGGTSFQEGEWVGEDANGNAVKLTNGTTIVRPAVNITDTNRNDVKESGKITIARGKSRLRTRVYKPGQTWTAGGKVAVESDGANPGEGKGTLIPLPGTPAPGSTYVVVGEVVTPPSADGDWLVIDQYADYQTLSF